MATQKEVATRAEKIAVDIVQIIKDETKFGSGCSTDAVVEDVQLIELTLTKVNAALQEIKEAEIQQFETNISLLEKLTFGRC